MNMVRVGGTMVYEDDAFHELCDALGILVWQDFMFANLDYPTDDAFVAGVRREARQLCQRLQGRPSLAVLCGNSEIEQQVAMLGLGRDAWTGALFQEVLPAIARELVPDVPYVPSSPCGGPLPFHPDVGVAHYYGVGAYLRPLEDARRAGIRFTSECLAFSNVPEPATVEALLGDGAAPGHHPRWKERVPRDHGPGWDFEDVRDHYVARLFGVDPVRVRYADAERWLDLGRVATGEVMSRTLAEWRHAGSTCAGALIWFWKDLWPGAGWGLVDADGRPKAAYFMARPVLAPVALLLTDEGLAGPRLHAVNDGPTPVAAELAVRLWRDGAVKVAEGRRSLEIPARGQVAMPADALFERFLDLSYAYRFGPPGHDALAATLHAGGALVGEAFFWPRGLPAEREPDVGLTARAQAEPGGFRVEVGAARLAVAVALDVSGGRPDESYFHLEPGRARAVQVRGPGPLRGHVRALNAHAQARISI
jgi:beta-mannosidase